MYSLQVSFAHPTVGEGARQGISKVCNIPHIPALVMQRIQFALVSGTKNRTEFQCHRRHPSQHPARLFTIPPAKTDVFIKFGNMNVRALLPVTAWYTIPFAYLVYNLSALPAMQQVFNIASLPTMGSCWGLRATLLPLVLRECCTAWCINFKLLNRCSKCPLAWMHLAACFDNNQGSYPQHPGQ